MNQESRGNWYLLTGLIIGLIIGLVYAWLFSPVEYVDTEPGSLAEAYKEQYRKVVALAYQAEGDIGRARERIALVDTEDPVRVLAAQAQRMIAANAPAGEARALSVLASDLGNPQAAAAATRPASKATLPPAPASTETTAPSEPTVALETLVLPSATIDPGGGILTATPVLPTATPGVTSTPTITFTPPATFTPRPTSTPGRSSSFKLKEKNQVCKTGSTQGLIQVQVEDRAGQPLPGIQIVVTWDSGEDIFYTGMAPEINPGYADFKMQAGTEYQVRVGQVGEEAKELTSDGNCNWQVTFTELD